MSTSFLYHTYGIVGYRYLRSEYVAGTAEFHIAAGEDQLRCLIATQGTPSDAVSRRAASGRCRSAANRCSSCCQCHASAAATAEQ